MQSYTRLVSFSALGALLATAAFADTIRIRRDDVLAIRFDSDLREKSARLGDRISATIEDRGLPYGSRLVGRVERLQRPRNRQSAAIEIRFVELRLPDGTCERIDASPVSRDYRGRRNDCMTSRPEGGNAEAKVGGGFLAGLLLGKAIKKPFEGAFLGTLAGILVAESSRTSGGYYFHRGDRYGAYFNDDFQCDFRGEWRGSNRNDDWRNSGDRDRRDERGDDRTDPRYDRRDDTDLDVYYGSRRMEFNDDCRPYWSGDFLMTPIESCANQLGLSCEFSERSKRFIVEDEDNSAILEIDSQNYRMNGKRRSLKGNIEERNGVYYVSIEFFEALKGKELKYNKRR